MTSPVPSQSTSDTGTGRPPDRLYVLIGMVESEVCFRLATKAITLARAAAPKLSGASAERLRPYYGPGFFGIMWSDPWVWFQEHGTRGRVMTNLAGKTIPMWIDDPTGSEKIKNPKAKTRVTASGKAQVLIFRRAAQVGARRRVKRKVGGTYRMVDAPASFPGAPGRIARRSCRTYPGGPGSTHTGRVGRGNLGVRWYNPGVSAKHFISHAILTTAQAAGLGTPQIHRR